MEEINKKFEEEVLGIYDKAIKKIESKNLMNYCNNCNRSLYFYLKNKDLEEINKLECEVRILLYFMFCYPLQTLLSNIIECQNYLEKNLKRLPVVSVLIDKDYNKFRDEHFLIDLQKIDEYNLNIVITEKEYENNLKKEQE